MVGAESQYSLISERLHAQVVDSELDWIIFSVGAFNTGSLEITHSPSCESYRRCSNGLCVDKIKVLSFSLLLLKKTNDFFYQKLLSVII